MHIIVFLIYYISPRFWFLNVCRLILPKLHHLSFYFNIPPPLGNDGGCGMGYVYISQPFAVPIFHVSISRGFILYITHHIWTRNGRERGVCGCACAHVICFWYFTLLSATAPLYLYFNHILSWGEGGGVDKPFILSKFTIPPPFPINHSTSSLCVSLFLLYVYVTVSVVFYVAVCYVPSP